MPTAEKIVRQLYGDTITLEFSKGSHRFKVSGVADLTAPGIDYTKPPISTTGVTGIYDKSRQLIKWAVREDFAWLQRWLEERSGQKFSVDELYPIVLEAQQQHEILKEKAASIGDMAHNWAESFAKFKAGELIEPAMPDAAKDPQVYNAVIGFLEWVHEHNVVFIHPEHILYSKSLHVAGITDLIALVTFCGKYECCRGLKGTQLRTIIDYKTSNGFYDDQGFQIAGYHGMEVEESGEDLDAAMVLRFSKNPEEGVPSFEGKVFTKEDLAKDFAVFAGLVPAARRKKELEAAWRAGNR